jgi:hypothetical protein
MPLLSVIVTITSGDNHTPRCLQALSTQRDAPPMEIIIPVYRSVDHPDSLAEDWPSVRFVEIPEDPPLSSALEHWTYDRRRAVGLLAACGEVIAMTEDHAIPGERWCATIWNLHQSKPYKVIGGAIRHTGTGGLNWAIYYCDFARYEPPFPAEDVESVSDINVSYKRDTLERCRPAWEHFFDEATVHGRIRRDGGTLHLTPEITIGFDRGNVRLFGTLRQRVNWGRVYGGRRAQKEGTVWRLIYAILSPALPFVLLARKFRLASRPGHTLGPFLTTLPFTFLCLVFWSLGEFIGYITARPFPRLTHLDEANGVCQTFGNF